MAGRWGNRARWGFRCQPSSPIHEVVGYRHCGWLSLAQHNSAAVDRLIGAMTTRKYCTRGIGQATKLRRRRVSCVVSPFAQFSGHWDFRTSTSYRVTRGEELLKFPLRKNKGKLPRKGRKTSSRRKPLLADPGSELPS